MILLKILLLVFVCEIQLFVYGLHGGKHSGKLALKNWSTKVNSDVIATALTHNIQDGDFNIKVDFSGRPCEPVSTNPSHNKVSNFNITDILIHSHYGPDEIIVMVEGKELHSFVAKYHGCNKYHATFRLVYSGKYHIKIVQLRSNYTALNEAQPIYPLIEYNYIVNDWIELRGTQDARTAQSCEPHEAVSHHHSSNIYSGVWVEKATLENNSANSLYNTPYNTATGITHHVNTTVDRKSVV